MSQFELNETITALIESLLVEDRQTGLSVKSVEITVPVELNMAQERTEIELFAAPPTSRFSSGFMNPIHQIHLTVVNSKDEGLM